MYISNEHNMIFLAAPRTGSRATAKMLRELYGFEKTKGHHRIHDLGLYPKYMKFTTVRNHFDAWVSWFCGGYGNRGFPNPMGFEAYLRKMIYSRQMEKYIARDGMWKHFTEKADVILRFEALSEGLSILFNREISLDPVGVSARQRDYRPYYNEASRALVESRYGSEMHLLGYKW